MKNDGQSTDVIETALTGRIGRRGFLKRAGLVSAALPVAGGLVVSACYDDPTGGPLKDVAPSNQRPGTPAPTQPATEGWVKMDSDHKTGVVNFLKQQKHPLTKGKGMQELAPRIENGVKVWDLTMDELEWEVAPGQVEKGRGYNNAIPGPTLRATVGDRVRINVKNNLEDSSSVHWHGLLVPNAMDGVPYLTQEPISRVGRSRTSSRSGTRARTCTTLTTTRRTR